MTESSLIGGPPAVPEDRDGERGAGLAWRLLDTAPAPGAWNMAVDAMLMEAVRAGAPPVLRFYRWTPRCLSLGRNQPAHGQYDEARLRARGLDVVRRPTGGRAVLHDRELTYSVILPDRAMGSPRTTYATVNRALVSGLRRLGVPAELQPRSSKRAPVPSLAPCFRDPAEGEVVVEGRKLVGSAQYRERGVILQHGSLLLGDDQHEVGKLLQEGNAAVEEPPAVLSDYCRPLPSWEELTSALADGWREVVGGALQASGIVAEEAPRVRHWQRHFSDLAWTWRR